MPPNLSLSIPTKKYDDLKATKRQAEAAFEEEKKAKEQIPQELQAQKKKEEKLMKRIAAMELQLHAAQEANK